MKAEGRLIVFEGPDGAGKTTLAQRFASHAQTAGHSVRAFSFPGKEPGTLGHHVYQLHHDPQVFGIRELTPASRQALHIAAHLDAIERSIGPALAQGSSVVLDRCWWSTWVYGTEARVNPATLNAMISCEQAHWGEILPSVVVLVTRKDSLRPQESGSMWNRRSALYTSIAERERDKYPVRLVSNDGTEEHAFSDVLTAVGDATNVPQSGVRVGSQQDGRPQ